MALFSTKSNHPGICNGETPPFFTAFPELCLPLCCYRIFTLKNELFKSKGSLHLSFSLFMLHVQVQRSPSSLGEKGPQHRCLCSKFTSWTLQSPCLSPWFIGIFSVVQSIPIAYKRIFSPNSQHLLILLPSGTWLLPHWLWCSLSILFPLKTSTLGQWGEAGLTRISLSRSVWVHLFVFLSSTDKITPGCV